MVQKDMHTVIILHATEADMIRTEQIMHFAEFKDVCKEQRDYLLNADMSRVDALAVQIRHIQINKYILYAKKTASKETVFFLWYLILLIFIPRPNTVQITPFTHYKRILAVIIIYIH